MGGTEFQEKQNLVEDTDKQQVWYNSMIKIQDSVIFFEHWYAAGVQFIGDLKSDISTILIHQQFNAKYQMNVNCVQFYSVMSAIPKEWRQNVHPPNIHVQMPLIEKICQSKKPSKTAYN